MALLGCPTSNHTPQNYCMSVSELLNSIQVAELVSVVHVCDRPIRWTQLQQTLALADLANCYN